MKKQEKTPKLKPARRISLVQKGPHIHSTRDLWDRKILKRIIKHLSKEKRKKNKLQDKGCCPVDSGEGRVDCQVKLKCRQLPNVVQELRKALMRQDWDEVATLVLILCHPGLKYYISIILKVCFILLFSHPDSNVHLVRSFIRHTTGYILEEDVNKFIRILFALRKSALNSLKSGRYIRKTGDYKVVKDPEFEEL